MLRRVLLILSVVGLVGTLSLWGLSYMNIYWSQNAPVDSPIDFFRLTRGAVSLLWGADYFDDNPFGWECQGFRGLGTNWWPPSIKVSFYGGHIILPMWMPAAFFSAFLGMRLAFFRRRRLGLCPGCGYDLTGSPGACPECGHEKE
jgi:hypothetical protein